MPFPEWEYYTLAQAAARWTATLEEVQHAIVAGKLHASVWLSPTYAYTITEHSPDNATRHPAQQLEGYVRVAPESCRIIFSKGVVARRKFLTLQPDSHYLIVEHLDKVEMRIEDLLILTEDMRSFEKAHNLAASKPCKVISVHKIKRDAHRRHSQCLTSRMTIALCGSMATSLPSARYRPPSCANCMRPACYQITRGFTAKHCSPTPDHPA